MYHGHMCPLDIYVSTKLIFSLLEYFKCYRLNVYYLAITKSNELVDLVGSELVFKKCWLKLN